MTGTMGILLKAKREGLILENSSVQISENLEEMVLEQVREKHNI